VAELIIRGIEEAKFVIFAKSPTSGRPCPGEIHSIEPDIAYRNTLQRSRRFKPSQGGLSNPSSRTRPYRPSRLFTSGWCAAGRTYIIWPHRLTDFPQSVQSKVICCSGE